MAFAYFRVLADVVPFRRARLDLLIVGLCFMLIGFDEVSDGGYRRYRSAARRYDSDFSRTKQ